MRRSARAKSVRPGEARRDPDGQRLFAAEAAYAESMLKSAMGDGRGCIEALERALDAAPTYAPALLSLGSVEYQRRRPTRGRRLFLSLLDLPEQTTDLVQIIDEAGDFLIQCGRYDHGLELFRRAAARFPRAAFHSGLACCAGHEGRHEEALAASRAALALEPDDPKLVNDLGFCLYGAGLLDEAQGVLERAVAMDPSDPLAAENVRLCSRELRARRASAGRPVTPSLLQADGDKTRLG